MPSGSAGRRYANAIFEMAKEQNKLEQWGADLDSISYAFSQPNVQGFLDNPKTSRDSKIQFVSKVLGPDVSQQALNLAQLLVKRERQSDMKSVVEEYTRLWNKERGIVMAEVTTAEEMSAAETEAIREQLSKLTGNQVTVNMKVDPEIIGGVIARIGDTLIDGSVRARLQNLRKQLA